MCCCKGKDKVVVGATSPSAKRVRNTKEVVMLPPPPQPTTEELASIWPESSILDASAPISVLPDVAPSAPAPMSAGWDHLGRLASSS